LRYGDLVASGDAVICVRESHVDGSVSRDIVEVALDGSAIKTLARGTHFLAGPRLSPDRSKLAWVGWEHPLMPWDGTELRITDMESGDTTVLLGSATESVLQPEWLDDQSLIVLSDRSGFWNPYRIGVDGTDLRCLYETPHDIGAPLWQLSTRSFWLLDDGALLVRKTFGTDQLAIVAPDGTVRDLDLPHWAVITPSAVLGNRVLATSFGSQLPVGLRELNIDTGEVTDIQVMTDGLPAPAYWPRAQARTFTGAHGDVHAFVYPPSNPDAEPIQGELPPYIVQVHGGPTGHARPGISVDYAYFTSRGIGVVDVNYGGSTGYGRAYRDRLRGQWGIVDVDDAVAVARGLAEAGEADPNRIAIRGGSAGGWTVLCAVTKTDAFTCGVSLFGVADAALLAEDTHDFESRYFDGLIGPLPDAKALYDERSPLSHVDKLSCPVLLLQGLDDPIVPPGQAEQFKAAMVRKQIPHAYLAFEGESHGFRKAETLITCAEATLSFLGQVMGFEPDVPRLELYQA
jgi:dipeptidyl aminopeptidase/acylaminoacyl peptidase